MNAALPISIALAVFGVGGFVWCGMHLAAANKRIDRLVAKATDKPQLPAQDPTFLAGPGHLPAAEVNACIADLERHANQAGDDGR